MDEQGLGLSQVPGRRRRQGRAPRPADLALAAVLLACVWVLPSCLWAGDVGAPRSGAKNASAPFGGESANILRLHRYIVSHAQGEVETLDFYDVRAEERPNADDPQRRDLTVRIGAETAIHEEGIRPALRDSYLVEESPRKGETMLVLKSESGGVHCCVGYYLLTRQQRGGTLLTTVSLGHSDEFAFVEDRRFDQVAITDTSLAYYSAGDEGQPGLAPSFANSPFFTRYLVYDEHGWRVDRPGEFAGRYHSLLYDAERRWRALQAEPLPEGDREYEQMDRAQREASALMVKAYYALMAGEPAEKVRLRFTYELPALLAPLTAKLFDDVRAQVQSFNPVTQRLYR